MDDKYLKLLQENYVPNENSSKNIVNSSYVAGLCDCYAEACQPCQAECQGCECSTQGCQCYDEACDGCQCNTQTCDICMEQCEQSCQCTKEICDGCECTSEACDGCQCNTQMCDICMEECEQTCQCTSQTCDGCQCNNQICDGCECSDQVCDVCMVNCECSTQSCNGCQCNTEICDGCECSTEICDGCECSDQSCNGGCQTGCEVTAQRPPLSDVINLTSGSEVPCVFNGEKLCAIVASVSTWTTFQSNINSVRRYKGLSDYSFTVCNYLTPLYEKYHEALGAICAMAQGSLSNVERGATNVSSLLNSLEDQLNSIA